MAFGRAQSELFEREDGHKAEQTCIKLQGTQRISGRLLGLLSTCWDHQTASLEIALFEKHKN